MPRRLLFFSALLLLLLTLPALAKVEKLGAFDDSSASEAVRKSLAPDGIRVALPDGTVVCDVWFRNALTIKAARDVEGANYPEFTPSQLVGVITLPKQINDYRGQPIKPGTYTLRYELLPTDGNHMGVAPNRDFLLLSPVSEDKDPAAELKTPELLALSTKASGTAHPAVLSLVTAEGDTFPGIYKNDDGHYVFVAKLRTSAEDLAIGVVVKGQGL
jgi:hypothetical protein